MKMNIGIVPAVREIYKNQFEFTVDTKWIKFLRKVYPNCNIKFLSSRNKDGKFDLIIFSGGNDLVKNDKSKKNKIRKKIDDFYYKFSTKNKIPLIGICHGAAYFGEKFGCKIKKKAGHVGNHKILLTKKNYFEKIKTNIKVNSYHNYAITAVSKKFEILAYSDDKTFELIRHKKKKILCIMWHPERNNKISNLDIQIFKKFICN